MFHSHNILYTLHTVKIEVNQCICVNMFMSVFLWYTSILTVCRFAGIKFFTRYRYQYDKNTFFSILLWYIAQLYVLVYEIVAL